MLFKKALNGDKGSFAKLLEPIKGSLYKIALTYMGNEQDALDCVHEAIVKAIKSLDKVKEPQYFNTWITRITINTCKDYMKRNNNIVFVDIKDYENTLQSENGKFEEREEVNFALSKLSESERELIVMRYLDDMSLNDISESKKVPLGTVKSKISRTLKKLRVYVKEA